MTRYLALAVFLWVLASQLVLGACASEEEQAVTPAARPVEGQVFVFSNSSPHVTVIDAETNEVTRTADISNFTFFTWNDDSNYYDGTDLWLGLMNIDTRQVEVIALNLNTLEVTTRLALGQEERDLYMGRAAKDGILPIGKKGAAQVVFVDTKDHKVLDTLDVDVGQDGVVCDMDVASAADGVDYLYIPTDKGNTVVKISVSTKQVSSTLIIPEATRPFMLTVSPDGKRVWVQERNTNGNLVLKAETLEVIKRVPTGPGAIMNTFSPDGKLSFTAHSVGTVVIANDAETLEEVWRAKVGTSPSRVAVHPAGNYVYATVSQEAALAVLDADTGELVTRIDLGTNPSTVFVRSLD